MEWHSLGKRLFVGAPVFGAAFITACSLIKSFDGFEGAAVLSMDAATADGGDGAAAPSCERRSWPEPPVTSEPGDIGTQTAGLRALNVFGGFDGSAISGLNLDALCTCPDAPACRGKAREPLCDPDGGTGIDNAGASLFEALLAAGLTLDDRGLGFGLSRGRYSILFRVDGYNGQPDDREVSVAIFNAIGVEGRPDGPAFDDNDTWKIDSESLPDGRIALYSSTRAWVRDSTLVAEIPALTLKVRVPTQVDFQLIKIELRDVHIVAKIEVGMGSARRLTLEKGIIAGRFPNTAAIAQAALNGICPGTPTYALLKARVCQASDLPLAPGDDGRDIPCEAISVGFDFSATAAKLGGVSPATDVDGCAPIDDNCEK